MKKLTETKLFMLASEESLKKTWDNKYDSMWDKMLYSEKVAKKLWSSKKDNIWDTI